MGSRWSLELKYPSVARTARKNGDPQKRSIRNATPVGPALSEIDNGLDVLRPDRHPLNLTVRTVPQDPRTEPDVDDQVTDGDACLVNLRVRFSGQSHDEPQTTSTLAEMGGDHESLRVQIVITYLRDDDLPKSGLESPGAGELKSPGPDGAQIVGTVRSIRVQQVGAFHASVPARMVPCLQPGRPWS